MDACLRQPEIARVGQHLQHFLVDLVLDEEEIGWGVLLQQLRHVLLQVVHPLAVQITLQQSRLALVEPLDYRPNREVYLIYLLGVGLPS